jgi:hypothetical protein
MDRFLAAIGSSDAGRRMGVNAPFDEINVSELLVSYRESIVSCRMENCVAEALYLLQRRALSVTL